MWQNVMLPDSQVHRLSNRRNKNSEHNPGWKELAVDTILSLKFVM